VPSVGARKYRCQNCDNCLNPPEVWDGTDAARKLLSTIYRIQQSSGMSFGAGHVMDICAAKRPRRSRSTATASLSTFGIGADFSEIQLRGVLRQLIAMGAVAVDAQAFNTLQLTEQSRAVLKGEVAVQLRESVSTPASRKSKRPGAGSASSRRRLRWMEKVWSATRRSRPGAPRWRVSTTCLPM
jgi:ATP-dependent DNA helicase RecQ